MVEEDPSGLFRRGSLVVPTVRRGCSMCQNCKKGRSDYCLTGLFKERGIYKLNGFGSEYFAEKSENLVNVNGLKPKEAILVEPLSIISKAYERFLFETDYLTRFSEEDHILVVGIGCIGQLAIRYLSQKGFEVDAWDIVDPTCKKVRLAEPYIRKYENFYEKPKEKYPIIFECSGSSKAIDYIIRKTCKNNGIIIQIGIPASSYLINLSDSIKQLVLKNISLIGVVNSCKKHFEEAVELIRNKKIKVSDIVTNVYKANNIENALKEKDPCNIVKKAIKW